nr:type IV toxin-antitoxin system AbiEi family antitoxin domain-containing protein [Patescibacteria group bacterium]
MNKKIKKGDYLDMILRSDKTVFTIKDISLLWQEDRGSFNIKSRLSKYVSTGKLIRLRRGIYVKDKNYDPLELAVKVYTPSYIIFENILNIN